MFMLINKRPYIYIYIYIYIYCANGVEMWVLEEQESSFL